MADSGALQRGDVFAEYVIERLLGKGGMGTVYLARHPRLPRLTALKLLNVDLFTDNEIRKRFEREADIAARLEHPNIVAVYDRGAEDNQLWISMQYVQGTDAHAVVAKGPLDPERALHIVTEVGKALDFAHLSGVLHRDVKPANILLAPAARGPERVLLTDFGIARARNDSVNLTAKGQVMATLVYGSPEQLSGGHVDHRSDQYSLGCTLFRLLTGASPFAGTNPSTMISGHLSQPVPAVSRVRPGLPAPLDAVISKAMAKNRDDRFPTCAEFTEAAKEALAGRGPAVAATALRPQPQQRLPEPPPPPPPPVAAPPPPPYPMPPQQQYPPRYPQPQPFAAPGQSPYARPPQPQFGPRPGPPGYTAPAQNSGGNTALWVLLGLIAVLVVLVIIGLSL